MQCINRMPEYICKACNFKTPIKCKYTSHLETLKHKNNNKLMKEDLNEVIQELRSEILCLKAKLEVYEMMYKGKPNTKEAETNELVNYNPKVFMDSLEIELTEQIIESVAELRANDDKVMDVNLENAYHSFMFNENNNLPYIKEFIELQTDPETAIASMVLEHVLSKCSVDVTEPYKGRFRLYRDKWLSIQDSTDLLNDVIAAVKGHFKSYISLYKYYYAFDSKLRTLDEWSVSAIRPKIKELERKLLYVDPDEIINYILKQLYNEA